MASTKGSTFLGFGSAIPERVMTNADLEALVETNDEWIVTRTGISERRIAAEGQSSSDLGLIAAEAALARSGVDRSEIDLLIVATSSPDMVFPSTACLLQGKLGLNRGTPAFDVMAVCTGFIYATAVADSLIRTGRYEKVMVVGADAFSRFIDWEDRGTCILFGDGAGAAIMAPCDGDYGIIDSYLAADGTGWEKLYIPAGGSALPASAQTVEQREHFVRMAGTDVFRFAVKAIPEACDTLLNRNGLAPSDLTFVIAHQANMRIIETARSRMGLPAEMFPTNLERYGNTSTASIPLMLDELWMADRLKDGDLLLLVGFGAGLTWGANLVRWSDQSGIR